jgi:GGDEF domain-containing protein
MGVGCYPCDGAEVEDLVRSADSRLYVAKQNGKNQISAAC